MPTPVEDSKSSHHPSFTIITVHFRDLEGLQETRNSVTDQIYSGEIEHLVIDGDSGVEVIDFLYSEVQREQLKNMKFRFISERDAGPYDAMNKGIENATGDILWFLNAGDLLADKYAIQKVAMNVPKPEFNWGYGATLEINLTGEISRLSFLSPYDFIRHAYGSEYVPHPSTFIGKNLAKALGGYDLQAKISADQVFLVRAGFRSQPILIPSVLAVFKKGGLSSSINALESRKQLRKALAVSTDKIKLSLASRTYLWIDWLLFAVVRRLRLKQFSFRK